MNPSIFKESVIKFSKHTSVYMEILIWGKMQLDKYTRIGTVFDSYSNYCTCIITANIKLEKKTNKSLGIEAVSCVDS